MYALPKQLPAQRYVVEEHSRHDGQLTTMEAVRSFVYAGKATFTVRSKKTGERFTYKATRPVPVEGKERPTWFKLLSGADNTTDYNFLGTVFERDGRRVYLHSRKSRVSVESASVSALIWFIGALNRPDNKLLAQCEVWHEGKCGRCGRKLTVPESIASGFGPECVQHM